MRKERFGSHIVNKRVRGERKAGLYEYQVIVNRTSPMTSVLLDSDLVFSDRKVTLTKYVPKDRWDNIDERLRKIGYRYEGGGVWIKSC